jgi:hypothetical protein
MQYEHKYGKQHKVHILIQQMVNNQHCEVLIGKHYELQGILSLCDDSDNGANHRAGLAVCHCYSVELFAHRHILIQAHDEQTDYNAQRIQRNYLHCVWTEIGR